MGREVHLRVSRREFVKRVGIVAGGLFAAAAGFSAIFPPSGRWQSSISSSRTNGEGSWEWFSAEEAELMGAIADVIIPPGIDGPGGKEAGVVEALDRRFLASPEEGAEISRALMAFDRLSHVVSGRPLPALDPDAQTRVVSEAERLYQEKRSATGIFDEARVKSRAVMNMLEGIEPAADSFRRMVRMVRDEFYTSELAWKWLGYEGPPFPSGYLNEVAERGTGATASCT